MKVAVLVLLRVLLGTPFSSTIMFSIGIYCKVLGMLEKTIENKCRLYASSKGWLSVKLNPINARGIPDRMFIGSRRILFVEFKRPGYALRRNQESWAERLAGYGFRVETVDSVEAFKDIIDTMGHLW